MSHRKLFFLLAIFAHSVAGPALATELPRRVGQCAITAITKVGTRLDDTPGSGSAVSFENGGDQVGYDSVPAIEHSRAGDRVRFCLVSVPRHCPKGDDRGRVYRTTNLRTHQTWTMADSAHMCGGA